LCIPPSQLLPAAVVPLLASCILCLRHVVSLRGCHATASHAPAPHIALCWTYPLVVLPLPAAGRRNRRMMHTCMLMI
jgi:hypothetical protein